jgi:DNA-directed RNA polymerase specialized sigma24 family protein
VKSKLTPRQREVVLLIDEGASRTEIAGELDLSPSTVRDIIAFLKDYYQCEAHELPEVTGVKQS